ncbi:MAG TPA: outer membrane beta-barrel protein [Gemmatimonadaceae bacterium]
MIAGLVVTGGTSAVHAQISSPIGVGLVGGTSSPAGRLSDLANSGWHAGAFIELNLPVVPVGFRLEGAWHQFHDKPFAGTTGTTGARIVAITLNATYAVLPLPIVKPYVIGGVGEYSVRTTSPAPLPPSQGVRSDFQTTTETKFGINVGAGVRVQVASFAVFVEARWHDINTSGSNAQMIPVSIGLRF